MIVYKIKYKYSLWILKLSWVNKLILHLQNEIIKIIK